jgi:hypothetical protein
VAGLKRGLKTSFETAFIFMVREDPDKVKKELEEEEKTVYGEEELGGSAGGVLPDDEDEEKNVLHEVEEIEYPPENQEEAPDESFLKKIEKKEPKRKDIY